MNNTFYVSSFRKNLVSLSLLDKAGYCFSFGNKKVDLIYNFKIIGSGNLSDGLYKLSLSPNGFNSSFNIEKNVTKRSLIKENS